MINAMGRRNCGQHMDNRKTGRKTINHARSLTHPGARMQHDSLVPRQEPHRRIRVTQIVRRRRLADHITPLEGAGDQAALGLRRNDKPLQDMTRAVKHVDAAAQPGKGVSRKDECRLRQPQNRIEGIAELNPQARPPCLALPGQSQPVTNLIRQMFQHVETP